MTTLAEETLREMKFSMSISIFKCHLPEKHWCLETLEISREMTFPFPFPSSGQWHWLRCLFMGQVSVVEPLCGFFTRLAGWCRSLNPVLPLVGWCYYLFGWLDGCLMMFVGLLCHRCHHVFISLLLVGWMFVYMFVIAIGLLVWFGDSFGWMCMFLICQAYRCLKATIAVCWCLASTWPTTIQGHTTLRPPLTFLPLTSTFRSSTG